MTAKTTNSVTPGMTIALEDKIYRVESSVKVTVAKGVPFVKTKLRNLMTDELIEKNFKVDQDVESVSLEERRLEFLYPEGKDFLFLDIDELEEVLVPAEVIGDKVNFMKEGVDAKGMFYGTTIFSVELPQFLELMVVKLESVESNVAMSSSNKVAVLETGAKVEVPLFIESGDIVKIDTSSSEFVQRI